MSDHFRPWSSLAFAAVLLSSAGCVSSKACSPGGLSAEFRNTYRPLEKAVLSGVATDDTLARLQEMLTSAQTCAEARTVEHMINIDALMKRQTKVGKRTRGLDLVDRPVFPKKSDSVTTPANNASSPSLVHPVYPEAAIAAAIEGDCDVVFNIDPEGRTFDVKANCSDEVFVGAAEQAISSAKFPPKIIKGEPVGRRNVVYPLQFKLPSSED